VRYRLRRTGRVHRVSVSVGPRSSSAISTIKENTTGNMAGCPKSALDRGCRFDLPTAASTDRPKSERKDTHRPSPTAPIAVKAQRAASSAMPERQRVAQGETHQQCSQREIPRAPCDGATQGQAVSHQLPLEPPASPTARDGSARLTPTLARRGKSVRPRPMPSETGSPRDVSMRARAEREGNA